MRDDAIDVPRRRTAATTRTGCKHTLWYSEGNRLDYKPVNLQPMSADVEPIASAKRTY